MPDDLQTCTSTAETIEEWAAREAHRVRSWTQVEMVAAGQQGPVDPFGFIAETKARALMAYRNKVAAGLSGEDVGYLAWADGRDRVSYYSKPCLDLGLIVPLGPRASDGWCVADFGREIARHLREDTP